MNKLKKKCIRIDTNLDKEVENICDFESISYSEFVRQSLINDGVLLSTHRNINFKKQYLISKLKNITSQYREIIYSSHCSDEFNYCLDLTLDKIESILVNSLSIKTKEMVLKEGRVKTISYIPTSNTRKRSFKIPIDLANDIEEHAEKIGSTFTEQTLSILESVQLISSDDIEDEERKLVEIVRFGNCINAYLKTLHTKRKSSGLSISDYRDLEFKLEMFLSILVHKLAMVGIERQ
ncbi:hypothetical protein ACSTG6_20535 [Vibrio parahaemolyticus]|nr:hypothetical protein [Vibrio parahaemolyticus]